MHPPLSAAEAAIGGSLRLSGWLTHVNAVSVYTLTGTPAEIDREAAALIDALAAGKEPPTFPWRARSAAACMLPGEGRDRQQAAARIGRGRPAAESDFPAEGDREVLRPISRVAVPPESDTRPRAGLKSTSPRSAPRAHHERWHGSYVGRGEGVERGAAGERFAGV